MAHAPTQEPLAVLQRFRRVFNPVGQIFELSGIAPKIVEQRRLKGIDDWRRAVSTLQYARGPLTPSREFILREVIEYAKHVLSAEEAAGMTVIDPAVISNLGDDVFGFETGMFALDMHRSFNLTNKAH